MNLKKLNSLEEIAKGVALIHDLVRTGKEVIPTDSIQNLKIYAIWREKGSSTRLSRVVSHPTTRRAGRA